MKLHFVQCVKYHLRWLKVYTSEYWWEEPTHWKRPWCWEKLKAKEERGRGWDSIIDSTDINLSKLQEIVKDRKAWCAAAHRVTKNWTWLSDWTIIARASLVAQMAKNMSVVQETWVWSLGEEHPLEKGMATQASILAWTIPWIEEPGMLQSMQSQRVGTTE